MAGVKLVLLVRFKSGLPLDEVVAVANSRADEFRALPGLTQKYYVQDKATGEYGGLYLWDSEESFDEYRKSELRATIARAYQVEGEPRIDVLDVLMPLREG
jgi:heme-degrading monooxygenase HmoA